MIFKILGSWLFLDGVLSILFNEDQSFKEHLVRIVRSGIGIFFFS